MTPGHSYEITPAPLLVSVTDASRLIGRPDPAFPVTYAGLVAGQTAATSDLSGTLRYLTGATASSPPGRYAVSATGLSSRNYDIRYAPGVLTVFPASAGVWIDAPPVPGAFVVNIGDMMEIWTNGEFVATSRRVRLVKEER